MTLLQALHLLLASPDAFVCYGHESSNATDATTSPGGGGSGRDGDDDMHRGVSGGGGGGGGDGVDDDGLSGGGSVVPFAVFRRLLQRLFESIATPWYVSL